MRVKHALAALATVLAVAAGNGLTAMPAVAAADPAATQCSPEFLDADSRLGPQTLPAEGPVAFMVHGYRRLAGLSAGQFLATYWDPAANGGQGGWRYPPDNGFLILDGVPVEFPFTLVPGQEVDRFGSEYGGFLAPEDTPYADRALPPQSLDDFDPAYTCNYHLYRVLKRFTAETGPIAAGFGQPGGGLQFQLVSSLLPGAPATVTVMWLVSHGYLQRLN